MKIIFPFLLLCLCNILTAQHLNIQISNNKITNKEKLNQKLSGYEIVSLNFSDFSSKEDYPESGISDLKITNIFNKKVRYGKRNLLGANYRATVSTSSGKTTIDPPETSNFIVRDALTDEEIGRLNIRQGNVNGIFFINNESYYIKPLQVFSSETQQDIYILYKAKNVLQNNTETLCDVNHAFARNTAAENNNSSLMNACYVLEVATESDYELYQKYSSDVNLTLQRVLDQFNIVEGIYLNGGIPLSFAIVYQNVWSTSSDPYLAGERFAMRDEFKAVWNDAANGFTGIDRDVAYMISGKVGTNGGAAFSSTAGTPANAYAVGQEFDSETDEHLIAHEIGHTLSASHDTGDDCTSGNKPISGTMCSFVGTQGFSSNSVSEISTYVNNNSGSFTEVSDLNLIVLSQINDIRNYITTSTLTLEATIVSPGEVRTVAGKTIILPTGFQATSGSFFNAKINPNMDICN